METCSEYMGQSGITSRCGPLGADGFCDAHRPRKPWWHGKGRIRIVAELPSGTEQITYVDCETFEATQRLFEQLSQIAQEAK